MTQQRLHGLCEVAKRRRQAPHHQPGVPALQPRQRQLQLHATLVADELVPLVDDHRLHAGQAGPRILAREHQAQRLGRGHQRRRQLAVLPRTLGTGRIAGAQPHAPARSQVGQWQLQRPHGVGGQSTHGRQPQHLQAGYRLRAGECTQPHRVGLAAAGAGVQHAAFGRGHGLPDLALEGKRRPSPLREPGLGVGLRVRGGGFLHRRIIEAQVPGLPG